MLKWEYSNSPGCTPTEPGFYFVQELSTNDDTTWLGVMMWELFIDTHDGVLRCFPVNDESYVMDIIDHDEYEETRFAGPIDQPDFNEA